jgi:peptidoglycan/LPS O-acetylase OafA/YrhL
MNRGQSTRAPLSEQFSLYLDLVRFTAAVLVVITHFVQYNIVSSEAAARVPQLGREAVMAFFVLSGFVIAYTTHQKRLSIGEYAIARFSRIYSVALPLLLLAFLTAWVVHLYAPVASPATYQLDRAWLYIPFHALFLGELWNFSETPPWLTPYWSLSYEVWYYVFFAACYYLRGVRRLLLAGLIFAILGHKLWLLLPVWLSGVGLYHWHQRGAAIPQRVALVGWAATLAALALYKCTDLGIYLRALGNDIWPWPHLRLGSADRYLADYVVCALIWTHFACAANAGFSRLIRFRTAIRSIASFTFTLYLAHALVVGLWHHIYGYESSNPAHIALITTAIALFTCALALVTERQKPRLQAALEQLSGLAVRCRQARAS